MGKTELTIEEKLAILQEKFGRKELSFGCEVEAELKNKKYKEVGVIFYRNGDYLHLRFPSHETMIVPCEHILKGKDHSVMGFNYKLLGHPLTLSDVLRAIEKKTSLGNHFFVDAKGGFFKCVGIDTNRLCDWNLDHNLLRDQSDETIDFIFDLLK